MPARIQDRVFVIGIRAEKTECSNNERNECGNGLDKGCLFQIISVPGDHVEDDQRQTDGNGNEIQVDEAPL
jgi:hypothetical protein